MFKFFRGEGKPVQMSETESGDEKLKRLAHEYKLHFGDIREIKMTEVEAASQKAILLDIKSAAENLGSKTGLDIYNLLKNLGVGNELSAEIYEKIKSLQ